MAFVSTCKFPRFYRTQRHTVSSFIHLILPSDYGWVGVGILDRYRYRYRYFSRPLLLDAYWKIVIPVPVSARYLSCPGFQTVSNACSARSFVCVYFCREYYIHANLSFLDGEICVIDYYTSLAKQWPQQKNNSQSNYRENKLKSEIPTVRYFRYL